jgi:predicted DNA-binding transcriptional regulator YafY
MDRSERFYKIDQLLKERKVVSFAAFRESLGVSRATLRRDIDYMRDRFNAPIEYDREANGYRFGKPRAGPRYELPGLWFSAQEIYALLTTLQLLTKLQPGLLDGQVNPIVERLRAILGRGDHSWKEIADRIRVFQPERRESQAEYFSVIAAGLLKRRRVWIRHYKRQNDRETEREVSPQRLVHYRDNWYLDAYCHLREDLRSFAVDAIRDARLLDTRTKEVPKTELDDYLASGYGIFAGRNVQWATLKFSASAARWVSAQNWHPKQRSRVESDGSYVLEIPYSDDRELVMEVMKFGPEVEVLEPAPLRARIKELHRQALHRYGGDAGSRGETPER